MHSLRLYIYIFNLVNSNYNIKTFVHANLKTNQRKRNLCKESLLVPVAINIIFGGLSFYNVPQGGHMPACRGAVATSFLLGGRVCLLVNMLSILPREQF